MKMGWCDPSPCTGRATLVQRYSCFSHRRTQDVRVVGPQAMRVRFEQVFAGENPNNLRGVIAADHHQAADGLAHYVVRCLP